MDEDEQSVNGMVMDARFLRLSHRPRRIEHAQLDSSFLWTMVIVLIGCIMLVTWGVILKIVAHRREIRRKLKEYGIVLGDQSINIQGQKPLNPDEIHFNRIKKRMRILSAQPKRRPDSNSKKLDNSRNERLSNLPALGDVSPNGLAPTGHMKPSARRGSNRSRQSNRSRNSRRSARPSSGIKLDPLPLRNNVL